jgi:cytochrome b6-f complex iron-sulfur subunit
MPDRNPSLKRGFPPFFYVWMAASRAMAFNEGVDPVKTHSPLGWVVLSVLLFILFLLVYAFRHASKNKGTIPDFIPKPMKSKTGPDALSPGGAKALSPVLTRRSFIALLGWAWIAFTAATLGLLTACLRFLFPNAASEPSLEFKAGFPDQFSIGVDERFKEERQAWIIRNDRGFYALSAVCTHLGCSPNWLPSERKFKCPCHGSGFDVAGVNFEGPAPRPLERFHIALADDGQIQVDEGRKYQYELGQWTQPGAFLEYKT